MKKSGAEVKDELSTTERAMKSASKFSSKEKVAASKAREAVTRTKSQVQDLRDDLEVSRGRDRSRNLETNIQLLHSNQRSLQTKKVALENRVEELEVDFAEATEVLAVMSDDMNVSILVDALFE